MITRLVIRLIFIFLLLGRFNSLAENPDEMEELTIEDFASQVKLNQKTKEEFFEKFKIKYSAYVLSKRDSGISGEEFISLTKIVNNFPTNKTLSLDLASNYCASLNLEKVDRDVIETRGEQIERRRQREQAAVESCKAYAELKLKSVAKENYKIAKIQHDEEIRRLNAISSLYSSTFDQEGSLVYYDSEIDFLDIDSVKDEKKVKCKLTFFKSNKIDDFINKYSNGSDINIQNLNDEVFKEVIETNVKSKEACARDREYNVIINHMLELSKKESRLLSIIGKDYVCFVKDQNKLTVEEIDRISILIKDNSSENTVLAESITSYLEMVKSRIINNEDVMTSIGDRPEYNAWNEFYRSYSSQCNIKSERATDYIPIIKEMNKNRYGKNCVEEGSDLNISECRISAVNKAIEIAKDYVLQNQEEVRARNEAKKGKDGINCADDIRSKYCTKAYNKNWRHEIDNWGVNKCLK